MDTKALPYGLRDVKLTPLSNDRTATTGPAVDLPASQTFSFSEDETFAELRGDDTVQASRGSGPVLSWGLDSGGISLEAYATIAGGTVTVSGTTPNIVKRFRKTIQDSRPYFKAEGQAINDNGGDFHGVVYACKADGSLTGTMGDNTFWISSAKGKGYGSLESATIGVVYDFVHNETAVVISTENNEITVLALDATGGTFTVTFAGQTTTAIAATASASVIQAAMEALSNVAPGDVVVTQVATGAFQFTWGGAYADVNITQPTADDAALTGGSASAGFYTLHQGG